MSKNSLNLSDRRFCTHNLNGNSFTIGELVPPQNGVILNVHEALELMRFLQEELYEYGDRKCP